MKFTGIILLAGFCIGLLTVQAVPLDLTDPITALQADAGQVTTDVQTDVSGATSDVQTVASGATSDVQTVVPPELNADKQLTRCVRSIRNKRYVCL